VWRLGCSRAQLHDLAAGLGADVPFFLLGGAALGLGRGDELYPLVDLPVWHVVLAWPVDGISTADAYAWHRHRPPGTRRRESAARLEALMDGNLTGLRNDLEAAVEARRPEIRQIRRELMAAGPLAARMSGSGSAVFALFSSAAAADRAATLVARPGRHVVVTRTLGRLAGGHRVV
jgi:4-diphosphocytidyl-2-C-methyl-D-erythritol kinase